MSLTVATGGFVLLLLTVPGVQGQDPWEVSYSASEICALKGSTVAIRCTYTYPSTMYGSKIVVEKQLWFTKESNGVYVDLRTDPDYSDRVEYLYEKDGCTLRITNVTESDSAQYSFRFTTNQETGRFTGSPGVALTVTELQVRRSDTSDVNSVKLECHGSCRLPDDSSYIWYSNGQKIDGQTSRSHWRVLDRPGTTSCAVIGHEDATSPSVFVKDHWDVTYTSTQIGACTGSTVEMQCTYTHPPTLGVKETFWFAELANNQPVKLKTQSKYRGRVHDEERRCALTITQLAETDSAVYKFRVITFRDKERYIGSPGVALTVKAPQLQVHVRRSTANQYSNWTELTCHSNCPLPEHARYSWYRNNIRLPGHKYFHLHTFDPADSYRCAVTGQPALHSPSVYAPKLPSVSVSPSGDIKEDSSVTLTCSSDANPAAEYTWYKKNGRDPLRKATQLVFRSIQTSDSGEYYCTADSDLGRSTSTGSFIDVKHAPRHSSVSVSPSAEVVEGSSVTLICSSDANPAATYTWYKENQTLPQGPGGRYQFTSIRSVDRGLYHCQSENTYGQINSSSLFVDVKYAPKRASVSVSPSGDIVEGSSVTLTCSSDANPAATYTWYKENHPLPAGPKSIYSFTSISSEDRGMYFCKSENQYGPINSTSMFIDVHYPPRLPSVSVSPSAEVVEGSSVTLTCSSDANPAATYTWYKEDEDSPKASGQMFTITDVRPEHSGGYHCEAQNTRGHQTSTLHLNVVAVFPVAWKLVTGAVVFLVIILLSVTLLIRKKRLSEPSSEPVERPDTSAQRLPGHLEEQEELHYASVRIMRKQTDHIYSNFQSAGPHRKEEEEAVEYSAVKFNSAGSAPSTRSQDTVEDPDALYSTVNKVR